jgi:hypothetical protein
MSHTATFSRDKGHIYRSIIKTAVEYLLVVLPVGIYVVIESIHRKDSHFIWESPEWAIAVIFLSFQGLTIFAESLAGIGSRLDSNFQRLLGLVGLILTIAASINVYASSEKEFASRLILFMISTLYFLLLVAAGKFAQAKSQQV